MGRSVEIPFFILKKNKIMLDKVFNEHYNKIIK